MGFNRFSENNVAVAGKRWCGLARFPSHSNIIFANVVISWVLATFFVNAERGLGGHTETGHYP